MGAATDYSRLFSDHSSLVCENSPPNSDLSVLESGHYSHKLENHSHDFEHLPAESKRRYIYPPIFGLLYALVFIFALYIEFYTSWREKPSDLNAIYACLVLPAVVIEWAMFDLRGGVRSLVSVFVLWMVMCQNIYVLYVVYKQDVAYKRDRVRCGVSS